MVKRLIISSLLAISVIGIIPVAASATWKQDKYKHSYWVENGIKSKDGNKSMEIGIIFRKMVL